jgi:serine/threonine-protein kinase
VRSISEDLQVGFVGECRVRKHPGQDQIVIDFGVMDSTGVQRWVEQYDRSLTAEDLYRLQGEISRAVAFNIGIDLTPEEGERVGRVLTESREAYLLYMRGNEAFLWERQVGNTSSRRSRPFYDRAIEVDPDFALAKARLALAWTYESGGAEQAQLFAESALDAMPDLPEGHLALGRIMAQAGAPEDAFQEFRLAQEANPSSAEPIRETARLQAQIGRFEEAIMTYQRAEGVDPRDPLAPRGLMYSFVHAHRYGDALESVARWEGLGGGIDAIYSRAWIHLLRGDTTSANESTREGYEAKADMGMLTVIGYPQEVVFRVSSPMQQRKAISALELATVDGDGRFPSCQDDRTTCARRAIFEEMFGDPGRASILWDSTRISLDAANPTSTSLNLLALAYLGLNQEREAIRTAEEILALQEDRDGRGDRRGRFFGRPITRVQVAGILAHAGEYDRAIGILEEELPAPSWLSVHILELDPLWDSLRDHPRFQALLEDYADDVEH